MPYRLFAVSIFLIIFSPISTYAQDNCQYIKRYMAPLEYPVKEWATSTAGPAPGEVEQRLVGPTECRIIQDKKITNANGVPYRHVVMATSGSVFGYTAQNSRLLPPIGTGVEGEGRENTFADHVFILQARGNIGPYVPGTAHYQYRENTPNSIEILIPENTSDWNGNLWMLMHGASHFSSLRFFPRVANQFNRYTEASESAGALMDSGAVVVWTRRDATGNNEASVDKPSNIVKLDNGTELGVPGTQAMGLNNSMSLLRDYTVIGENFIADQLGKAPDYTFFRGHSAGAATGRSMLMVKGANIDHDGNKLFDGFYLDDSAGGRGAPTYFWEATVIDEIGAFRLEPSDKDQMSFDPEHRSFMSPVIEVIHAAYSGGNTSTVPRLFERVYPTYANYKRENARLNIEKGIDDIWKSYEIADVSHSDAQSQAEKYPELAAEMIDIGGVAIALHRALEDWVINGKQPPGQRVEARDVWEIDPRVGPSIKLPETACPRGVFRTYMNRPDGTAIGSSPAIFVPYLTELRPQINANQPRPPGFQEDWLEPLNRYGYLIDMTGSGHRMTRPNIEQVWHQRYREGYETGILKPYENLTRDAYVQCVAGVVNDLYGAGLLTKEAQEWYIDKARTDEIGVD